MIVDLAIVANREGRTNFHRSLGRSRFFVVLRLLHKINRRFIVVRLEKGGSLFETRPAHRAGRVDIPRSGSVQGLFAVFVRHKIVLLEFTRAPQCLFSISA
jgi:hypothetical protein